MTTLTITLDATNSKMTWLNAINTDGNHGGLDYVDIGRIVAGAIGHALIQINTATLAALPSNAIISSVTLKLWCLMDMSSNAGTLQVFRLLRTWVEGTGDGFGDPDGATWDTYDGSLPWDTEGAVGAGDIDATPIATLALTATEAIGEFKTITFNAAVTSKAALDAGYGWLLKMDTEAAANGYRYTSHNEEVSAQLPVFTVVYTLPAGAIFNPANEQAFRGAFG